MNHMTSIRPERIEDIQGICLVREKAFGRLQEAEFINKLRSTYPNFLSLVALRGDQLLGHLFFSPVTVEGDHGDLEGMGLAPMVALPDYQRRGIGPKLIRSGIDILKKNFSPFIIVLGHPHYYPRSGFEPAPKYGIRCQWEGVEDEAFMILWLDESKPTGVSRIAKYREDLNEAI